MSTTLASAIDIFLYNRGWLNPIVSIIWSIIAFVAWIFVMVAWVYTEWWTDTGGFLSLSNYNQDTRGYLFGTNDYPDAPLYYGRMVTAGIAAAFALVQMSMAARSVDLERKERIKIEEKEMEGLKVERA